MGRSSAWSYSRLNSYETCPKKFWHTAIEKNVKEPESEAMRYGTEVHKALELRIGKGKKLPMHLTHLEKFAVKLADPSREILTEQKLAITDEFEPTGFFDKDVWCRAILDLSLISGDTAILIDHKTGRISDDFTQMKLAAAMFKLFRPEIKNITIVFWWIKEKTFTQQVLTEEDINDLWNELLPRVSAYNEAFKRDEFPARSNGLCRKYCWVKTCPHNG